MVDIPRISFTAHHSLSAHEVPGAAARAVSLVFLFCAVSAVAVPVEYPSPHAVQTRRPNQILQTLAHQSPPCASAIEGRLPIAHLSECSKYRPRRCDNDVEAQNHLYADKI